MVGWTGGFKGGGGGFLTPMNVEVDEA